MGRYYNDKVNTTALDPANPFFGPIKQSALAINQAETDWYKQRSDMFKELNGGNSAGSPSQVEVKYANLKNGLSVYDFKATFNNVNPSAKASTGSIRYVHVPWVLTTFTDGFATNVLQLGEEDDDGDALYEVADDVLAYPEGAGKAEIDTLYTNLKAFSTYGTKSGYKTYGSGGFYDDDDYLYSVTVYEGFGELPLRWNAKSGYSSQQLQVMNIAGSSYNSFVGPKNQ